MFFPVAFPFRGKCNTKKVLTLAVNLHLNAIQLSSQIRFAVVPRSGEQWGLEMAGSEMGGMPIRNDGDLPLSHPSNRVMHRAQG